MSHALLFFQIVKCHDYFFLCLVLILNIFLDAKQDRVVHQIEHLQNGCILTQSVVDLPNIIRSESEVNVFPADIDQVSILEGRSWFMIFSRDVSVDHGTLQIKHSANTFRGLDKHSVSHDDQLNWFLSTHFNGIATINTSD